MKTTVTGQSDDPAVGYATAHLARADVLAERVHRAKTTLLGLPRLTAPLDYVTARQVAVTLQPDALLTVAHSEAFIAAVEAAEELVP